jgi:cholesterol transport system auxiliary component
MLKMMWSAVSVDAPVWLQDENIRYRLLYAEPSRVRFYAQDRWLAPPSAMLAQRLSLVGNRQGLRLKIKLFEFEQVFDDSQRARMRLVFRAFALRRDSEDMVGEKLFNLSLPTPSTDAKGAVTASALLMDEAVDLLQVWFKGLSEQR